MRKLIDITGKKFNRLLVLERSYIDNCNFTRWKCICDCGNIVFARAYPLKKEAIKSCGCLNNELRSKRVKTHGRSKEPIYKIWASMKARCFNPNNKRFHRYGGRGITICESWLKDPMEFINWSELNGYKKGLTIDRKNNDGHYTPDNCRYVERRINNQNSSNCKITMKMAEEIRCQYKLGLLNQTEIANNFGLTQQTISKITNNKSWKNG